MGQQTFQSFCVSAQLPWMNWPSDQNLAPSFGWRSFWCVLIGYLLARWDQRPPEGSPARPTSGTRWFYRTRCPQLNPPETWRAAWNLHWRICNDKQQVIFFGGEQQLIWKFKTFIFGLCLGRKPHFGSQSKEGMGCCNGGFNFSLWWWGGWSVWQIFFFFSADFWFHHIISSFWLRLSVTKLPCIGALPRQAHTFNKNLFIPSTKDI